MDVEKARVTGRAERLNAEAAGFLTGRTNDVAERLFHGALVSRARMKPSEDEQLQASSSQVMVAGHRGDSPPAADPPQLDLPAGPEAEEQDQRWPVGLEGSGGDGHEPLALVDEAPAPELDKELVRLEHALVDTPPRPV